MKKVVLTSILVVVISVATSIIGAEIYFRIFWNNPYRKATPAEVLLLEKHEAGLNEIVDRSIITQDVTKVKFRTDDRSYIMPSVRYKNPDLTITFLGGSTTECIAVQEELRFPALVSEKLAEHGLRVNCLNLGHSGNNLHDAINLLFNHAVIDSPDVAVVMHACNDIGVLRMYPHYEPDLGEPLNVGTLNEWYVQVASRYSSLLGFIRKNFIGLGEVFKHNRGLDDYHMGKVAAQDKRIEYQNPDNPRKLVFRSHLNTFIDMCRNFGIEPVLMTQPIGSFETRMTPPWLSESLQYQFNEIIREVCAERSCMLIDLENYIYNNVENFNEPMVVFYDRVHVSDNGSKIYADFIASEIYKEFYGLKENQK